jgi:hypothetical protein
MRHGRAKHVAGGIELQAIAFALINFAIRQYLASHS